MSVYWVCGIQLYIMLFIETMSYHFSVEMSKIAIYKRKQGLPLL